MMDGSGVVRSRCRVNWGWVIRCRSWVYRSRGSIRLRLDNYLGHPMNRVMYFWSRNYRGRWTKNTWY